MTDEHQEQKIPIADEGSWVYLIAAMDNSDGSGSLRERVVETCEASGWPAVSGPPLGAAGITDPGYFFEGVRHAVEHADVVVAILGNTAAADAELAMAYGHRRPIVGIHFSGEGSSEIQAMLESYERARVIACDDVDGCTVELRNVLSDPDFAATIRTAAGEHAGDA